MVFTVREQQPHTSQREMWCTQCGKTAATWQVWTKAWDKKSGDYLARDEAPCDDHLEQALAAVIQWWKWMQMNGWMLDTIRTYRWPADLD